jgi:type II secretory pathway component PulC
MKKRELILILTGILFFIFFGSFASAVTNVTACGTLGSAGEYYTLNQSIESTETCITIGANNIVLDCAGYNITYSVNGVSSKTHKELYQGHYEYKTSLLVSGRE